MERNCNFAFYDFEVGCPGGFSPGSHTWAKGVGWWPCPPRRSKQHPGRAALSNLQGAVHSVQILRCCGRLSRSLLQKPWDSEWPSLNREKVRSVLRQTSNTVCTKTFCLQKAWACYLGPRSKVLPICLLSKEISNKENQFPPMQSFKKASDCVSPAPTDRPFRGWG